MGTHGISIHFTHPKEDARGTRRATYSATFLPEVASELGWDVLETIKHLIEKAGCHIVCWDGDGDGITGHADSNNDNDNDDNDNGVGSETFVCGRSWGGSGGSPDEHGVPLTQILRIMRVERYQSSKASARYHEYAEFVAALSTPIV